MAKKDELNEDMTFDYHANDDFPTQNGTIVNNFEEDEGRKPLAIADVADKIAKRNSSEDGEENSNVVLWGVLSGFALFAVVVVIDVLVNV